MSDEWIGGKKAVLLIGLNSTPQLRRYLLSGVVSSRCKLANLTSRAPSARKHEERDWSIPPEIWNGDLSNSVFQPAKDVYRSRDYSTGYASVELIGLTFMQAELVEAFDVATSAVESWQTLWSIPKTAPTSEKKTPGKVPEIERYGEFAAGLAFIANHEGLETFKSRSGIYDAVSIYLAKRGLSAIDEKQVRRMIDLARVWNDDGGSPDNYSEPE